MALPIDLLSKNTAAIKELIQGRDYNQKEYAGSAVLVAAAQRLQQTMERIASEGLQSETVIEDLTRLAGNLQTCSIELLGVLT